MKAISLWQPWASAIAFGSKTIETRSWGTHYRGPLAIHASKRCVRRELSDLLAFNHVWRGALWPAYQAMVSADDRIWDFLHFGAVVAVADVVDCRYTDTFRPDEIDVVRRPQGGPEDFQWTERMMGDFSRGRFGRVLDNVRALPSPLPFKGEQRFFEVPDAQVQAALAGAGVAG